MKSSFCQTALRLSDPSGGRPLSDTVSITVDNGYTLSDLIAQGSPVFTAAPERVSSKQSYWLKISVDSPNQLSKDFLARRIPQLNNTLYYFEPDQKKWTASRTDASTNSGSTLLGRHQLHFPGQISSVFFVKLDFSMHSGSPQPMKLEVSFQPARQPRTRGQSGLPGCAA